MDENNAQPAQGTSQTTYNEATGMTNIPESDANELFGDPSPSTEPAQPAQQTPEVPQVNAGQPQLETPGESQNDSQQPQPTDPNQPQNQDTNNPQTQQPEQPKLLAGRYTNEQDLNNAMISIGIDPQNYSTPVEKEAAFMAAQRQIAFQQQQAAQQQENQQRLEQQNAQRNFPEQIKQELTNWVNGMQFQDEATRDYTRMIVDKMAEVVGRIPQGPDVDMITRQASEAAQAEMRKSQELTDLESDLPILKMQPDPAKPGSFLPNPHRDMFAAYIKGLQSNGQFISLKDAARQWLGMAQATVQNIQTNTQKSAENKAIQQAITPQPGNQSVPQSRQASPEDDILNGIVNEYANDKKKYGF